MGQVIDVVPTLEQTQNPFRAYFEQFAIGHYIFNDCYSDEVTLNRSIARISQDNARAIVFQIFLGGDSGSVSSHSSKRQTTPRDVGFASASAFTRAFRRSFDLAPQDLRQGEMPAAQLDRSDWVEWHPHLF